jgi:hypothetical protein
MSTAASAARKRPLHRSLRDGSPASRSPAAGVPARRFSSSAVAGRPTNTRCCHTTERPLAIMRSATSSSQRTLTPRLDSAPA